MDIGISIWPLKDTAGYDAALPRLAEIGYRALDVPVADGWRKPDEAFSGPASVWRRKYGALAEQIRGNGLRVSQTHATFPTDLSEPGAAGRETIGRLEKEIEATAILGSPYIVVHPVNIAWNRERKQEDYAVNMEFYAKLIPVSERTGVRIAIENMFSHDGMRDRIAPTGCSFPEDMIAYADGLRSDRFVCCLDTGHMNLHAVDPGDAARALGDRLKVLHVHDNFGIKDNHCLPGAGTIDWKKFVLALGEIGFDGAFSLEIDNMRRAWELAPELALDYAEYAYKVAKALLK